MADETPPPPPPQPPTDSNPPPPPELTDKEQSLNETPPPPATVAAESTLPPAAESAETQAPPPPPEAEETPREPPPPPPLEQPPPQEEAIVESEKPKEKKTFIQPAVSFKEESNLVSDLSDSERKSLDALKTLVADSLSSKPQTTIESALKQEHVQQQQTPPNNQTQSSSSSSSLAQITEEISIWGIPLLKDDRTDVILLKFLRARDFKVNESFQMLKNTLKWRADFGIDKLIEEDLGDDLDRVVFIHGHDREGHPVCYNVYGEFQNKELYAKTFSSEVKREKFLRWRIQFLEKSIRKLDFRPGGVNTIFQVNDLKNAPGPGKRELRQATRQALQLLQDNYPEFVAKQVFINVPWWYVAFYTMMSPFMTQRTKSKFVFTGPAKTAETLFKYISPEQVPIQYGGLSVDYCECNPDFTVADPATEINLKTATKQYVEIICSEKCVIMWEVRVVGWDVTYSAEFVPTAKDGYTVIIQKATKMSPNDDPVISGSFKITEVGKIVLTIDNPTFKRRKLLYRYKVLPFSE